MADGSAEVGEKEKKEIAKWFLTNAPAGEIQYVAKGPHFLLRSTILDPFLSSIWMLHWFCYRSDVRLVLGDDVIYERAAAEAFPAYNKAHLISLEMPDGSGDVSVAVLHFVEILSNLMI